MKSTTFICILIIFSVCIVNGLAVNLGSFFRTQGSHRTVNKVPSSLDELPKNEFLEHEQTEEDTFSYSSESYSEYRSDSDLYAYNSSSEDLKESFSANASSDGNDTSQSVSTQNTTSDSVSNSVPEESSGFHSSESISVVHLSSESSESGEVVWNKVSTPARPQTSTLGQMAAVNVTTEEQEEVVLATGETVTQFGPKTIFQKSIDWVEDEYTLSILLPISAGIMFAITIICTIAMCRCCRRCCRRRRFRKKCLPDSVRSLSASDRARLLGDTSDEEF